MVNRERVGTWITDDGQVGTPDPSNLCRYVGNNPTNQVDPSGQNAISNKQKVQQWKVNSKKLTDILETPRRPVLDSLDTTFALTNIPMVEPDYIELKMMVIPEFYSVHIVKPGTLPLGSAFVTPAEAARINIRINLLGLKQYLVTDLVGMFNKTTPADPSIKKKYTLADYIIEANKIADAYIRGVDQFLKDHPGAKPELGSRNALADTFGFQDAENAPWCADWASAMTTVLIGLRSSYIGVDHGQFKEKGLIWDTEHNFAIVRPRGYKPRFLPDVDDKILLFDPWRDLLPRAYRPTQIQNKIYAPTNTYP